MTEHTIPNFYDPKNFEEVCEAFAQIIRKYLTTAVQGEIPVLNRKSPQTLLEEWSAEIPAKGQGWQTGVVLVKQVIADSIHIHHPHYMGHQVTGPLPMTILCDMIMSMLNNSSAVYEMGQVATALELKLIEWICRLVGYPETAGGIVTSGGSMGNFTALLAARQVKSKGNVWCDGYADGVPRPAILVSEQAHYCVKRAVQMMGMGEGGAIAVPVDDEFRMDVNALRECYKQAEQNGRQIIAVAASACTTPTGTYDPLMEIADFCEEKDVWMHVDGAHGLAAVVSDKYRHLVKGLERADSFIWDLHKMMLMPSLLSAVVFKKNEHSYQAFAQEASYLFNDPEVEAYNLASRTLECTKPMMPLKAYISLVSYGTDAFGEYINHCFDLAKYFAKKLEEAADFEVAVTPDCNIVCFRYVPKGVGESDLDTLQTHIRSKIIESGEFYLVQTKLHDIQYMRVTLLNPLTSEEDINYLMDLVRKFREE